MRGDHKIFESKVTISIFLTCCTYISMPMHAFVLDMYNSSFIAFEVFNEIFSPRHHFQQHMMESFLEACSLIESSKYGEMIVKSLSKQRHVILNVPKLNRQRAPTMLLRMLCIQYKYVHNHYFSLLDIVHLAYQAPLQSKRMFQQEGSQQ